MVGKSMNNIFKSLIGWIFSLFQKPEVKEAFKKVLWTILMNIAVIAQTIAQNKMNQQNNENNSNKDGRSDDPEPA